MSNRKNSCTRNQTTRFLSLSLLALMAATNFVALAAEARPAASICFKGKTPLNGKDVYIRAFYESWAPKTGYTLGHTHVREANGDFAFKCEEMFASTSDLINGTKPIDQTNGFELCPNMVGANWQSIKNGVIPKGEVYAFEEITRLLRYETNAKKMQFMFTAAGVKEVDDEKCGGIPKFGIEPDGDGSNLESVRSKEPRCGTPGNPFWQNTKRCLCDIGKLGGKAFVTKGHTCSLND